jgi:hypothetical protein
MDARPPSTAPFVRDRSGPGMLRRLRPLDRVLLLTLVPLWAVLFGLQLTKVLGR